MNLNFIPPPSCQFVRLVFDPFGLGYVDNLRVELFKNWKYCFKVGTGRADAPFVNNIYLGFTTIVRDNAGFGPGAGAKVVAGRTPYILPLEVTGTNIKFVWHFPCGLPGLVYLMADYQGDGLHTDLICFCDDLVEMEKGFVI